MGRTAQAKQSSTTARGKSELEGQARGGSDGQRRGAAMTVGSTRAEGQGRLFGAAGRNAGLGRGIGSGRQRSRGAQVGMSENEGGGCAF